MIKIENITPIESIPKEVTLASIEKEYLGRIKKRTNPYDLLCDFINTGNYKGCMGINAIQIQILEYLRDEFDQIIIGSPQQLQSIINLFLNRNWLNLIYYNDETTIFGNAILDIFGYTSRFRGVQGKGIWLAKKLNIKTCPYCNAQYTLVVNDASQKELLKFQLDHFYPKSIYPFLSISLYNLIPSCANCNLIKSSKEISIKTHYHPYHHNLSFFAHFKLKYLPNPKLLTINNIKKQTLEVTFQSKFIDPLKIVETHNKLYQIDGIYARHNDVIEELLIKAIIYNSSLRKSQMKIKNLFNNDVELYGRYLLGNYPYQKDILKRPLSKFTQDIARQIKLIP